MCQVDPFDKKYSKVGIWYHDQNGFTEEQETAEKKVHTQLYLSVRHNVLANVLAKNEVFRRVSNVMLRMLVVFSKGTLGDWIKNGMVMLHSLSFSYIFGIRFPALCTQFSVLALRYDHESLITAIVNKRNYI